MKKFLSILVLSLILVLAYCRYTYVLNPNFSGEPVIIKIMDYGNLENQNISADSIINIKSIIIYWTLFFVGNVVFFLTVFSSAGKIKSIVVLYLLISLLSAFFFALEIFLLKSPALFSLASILKNFLLTPAFTAIGYIMIAYFHRFGKSD